MIGKSEPRCNRKPPVAVVAGAFQNGKSTLVNCLLDDKYARMGKGCRTTTCCTRFIYGEAEEARLFRGLDNASGKLLDRREEILASSFSASGEDCIEITCWKPMLRTVSLIDTPGFDANNDDDATAKRAITTSDIVVIVHRAKGLDEPTRRLAREVFASGKKVLFLCNCTTFDNWSPTDRANLEICESIEAELDSAGLSSMLVPIGDTRVWPCNPLWAWFALGHVHRDLESASEEERADAAKSIRKIQTYCSDVLQSADKRSILEASGILPVRRVLENVAASLSEAFQNDPRQEAKFLASAWMQRIRNIAAGERAEGQAIGL